ncbi:MAG: ABC transporter permease [Bacteroides sp.]|nr:ABC transporter permease [Bacteroides sp.]
MSLALFIANRLSLRSTSGKMQSGVAIAITGIALSVVVMLISIAVMMGFKDEVRHKIMGFDAQVSVSVHTLGGAQQGKLVDMDEIGDIIARSLPENASTVLTIRQPVILKTENNFSGAVVKGMSRDYDWKFIRDNLVDGVIPDYEADSTRYHIVISRAIARDLSIGVGEKLDAYFLGHDGAYRTRRLKVAAIYDTHFNEYDENYIFSTLPMLSALAGIGENFGTQLEIQGLKDDAEIAAYASSLSGELHEELYRGRISTFYDVTDIHTSAALYFNWLALLDTNVVVILTLMSLLTCLTLVSSLYILILRRVNMIGVLKALGATDGLIRRSFVLLTLRILAAGLLIGNLIAIGLIVIQNVTGVIPLDPEAYYLDHVPMQLSFPAIIILNIGVIVVASAVLILPSAIITTIPPSRVINYD